MNASSFSTVEAALTTMSSTSESSEDGNFRIWVVIILFIISVTGLFGNFANIYITLKSPVLHNAFGHLCASHSLAETLNLLIAGVWTIVVAVINDNLANTILSNKLGQVAVGVCLLTSYTVLVKAVNRFMAFSTPMVYRAFFNNENSKFMVGITWLLGFCHGAVGFFDGCNLVLDPVGHFWYFDTTPCGQFLAVYIDLCWSCFIMAVVVILDSITLYNLFKFKKTLRMATRSEVKKRSLDIRFFIQSCVTTLLQVLMLISFHIFSRFAESAWAVFFTTTFAWAASSAVDGIVNFGFNIKHLKAAINPSSFVTTIQKSQIGFRMAGSWYSPHQALGIAFGFAALDIFVVMMGLMWDGKFFTTDNIIHWFDFRNYDFCKNPVDFLGVAILRVSVLLGGALGVYANPQHGPEVMDKYNNLTFAIMLIIIAFSPTKLLAFYEYEDNKLVIGDWILMLWCIFASLFVQGIWVTVFARVHENPSRRSGHVRLYDDEDEAYYTEQQRKEEERDAQKRETFKMLLRLFGYMGKEWAFYSVAFTFLFLYSLARVFTPYYTGEVVASVFGKDASYANLHKAVGVMTLLSLASSIFGGFRGGFFTYSQARVDRRIRNDLFRSLVKQEIAFFDANKTGEVVSRLNADCQTMSNTLSLYMNVLTRNVTMLFGSLIFMFTLSWRLSMVTFIAVPLIFLVSKVYGVYYDKLAEDAQASIAKSNDVAEEVLSAIRTVKSFACEKYESLRFLTYLNVTLSIGAKKAFAHIGFLLTTELLQMGILTVVLFYGGHLVILGKIDAGLLVSFLLYQFTIGENLRELGEVWNGLMQAVGASRKVFELIDREPTIPNKGTFQFNGNNGKLQGKIEFRNVKFNYPTRPDIPIMNDLSFTVNPGEVVALVGPSGGGKSSCIAMLEHFYEPNYGDILLDGISVRDYDHKFLHTKIALVGQEPVLYARSVRENIAYGLDYVTEDVIVRAAQHANAHTFIMDTVDQYETDVGEKGSQMSGGQKQRIAIARALVRDPVVLLLDEATSALDSESEHIVQEAIQKNLKGRTVILIAHRLSTVENADKIVVISGGRVVEQGVHKELLMANGLYKQLVQRQMLGQDLTEEDVRKTSVAAKHKIRRSRAMSPTNQSVSQSFLGTSLAGSLI